MVGFAGRLASFGTVALALLFLLPILLPGAAEAGGRVKLGEFIPAASPQPAPQVGFTDLYGKPASLADFRGMPVVVNLWATWCRPCREEMPSLERLQSRLEGRLVVAAVAQDRDGALHVGPFVFGMGLRKLAIYLDPQGGLARAFHVPGLPTSILIDAEGRVVGQVEGSADWNGARMWAVIRPLLKRASGTLRAAAR